MFGEEPSVQTHSYVKLVCYMLVSGAYPQAHVAELTASQVLGEARPPQICGQAIVCPRHHDCFSVVEIWLASMVRLPEVE